jgi:hypothetical protein
MIVPHLAKIVFLYEKYHSKDDWITGLNMLVKILQAKI